VILHINSFKAVETIRGHTRLLDRGLSAERPVAVLSDNSLDHARLALAAMHVGVPVAPVSPAYSLVSQDHAQLRHIMSQLCPGLVYAADGDRFAKALAAIDLAPRW
jgi:feruloyl-CoA synthase